MFAKLSSLLARNKPEGKIRVYSVLALALMMTVLIHTPIRADIDINAEVFDLTGTGATDAPEDTTKLARYTFTANRAGTIDKITIFTNNGGSTPAFSGRIRALGDVNNGVLDWTDCKSTGTLAPVTA